MKKTFTINISGTVFHIDEDAHEKLSNYLNQLTRYFGSDPDAKEIVEDIESRISELFSQRIKTGNEVITLDLVTEVIQIMGMPEAISEPREKEEEPARKIFYSKPKRLYRDPDDRVLGGVCSGLGAFFSMDPVLVRVLFFLLVILGAGSFVLVYIIMWIVVPKAKSTAEKLEMKGQEVNISTISKSIKEEFQDVRDNFRQYRSSAAYSTGRENVHNAGSVILSVLKALLKIAVVVIGGFFVIISIIVILALIISFIVGHAVIGFFPWSGGFSHFMSLFVSSSVMSWFYIGLTLVIGIPLVMLCYLGLRIIFRFRSGNKQIGLSMLGAWLIGIFILISSTVSAISGFRNTSTSTRQEILPTNSDTLYLKLGQDEFADFLDDKFKIGNLRVASMNGKNFLVGSPQFDIEKSETSNYSLVIRTEAKGNDLEKAQLNARQLSYNIDQKDSIITFKPWFVVSGESSWHMQKIRLILKVPVNKTVYLDEEMGKIIHDIQNTSNTWDGDMVGKYWTMTPEGLEMAKKKPAMPLKNGKPLRK